MYVTEMSVYRNVRLPQRPFTEMSCDEISAYRNVRLAKCPSTEMFVTEVFSTEMSAYRNVRLAKCPLTEISYVEMFVSESSVTDMSVIRGMHQLCRHRRCVGDTRMMRVRVRPDSK